MIRRLSLLASVCALAPLATAQNVLYQTSFDDATGWTQSSGTCWSADDTPADFVPGPAHSLPNSLNCNNGTYAIHCFDTSIDSPAIDLTPASLGATLSFWCAFELEEDYCDIEARHVQISNDGFQTLLADVCYLWGHCGGANNQPWHQHFVPLNPAWGVVHVRFLFDAYDYLWGGIYDGWFVDDLVVTSDCPQSVPYCTAKQNSAGCSPDIYTTGTPSYSGAGAAFRIHASDVLNAHPGILIWSLSSASNPFGGGTLCLAAPVNRTPGQASGGNPYPPGDCSGSYSFNFTSGMMVSNGLLPGTAVFVQYWSRDTGFGAPNNIGLTAGMRFAVCD